MSEESDFTVDRCQDSPSLILANNKQTQTKGARDLRQIFQE
jgi:hypothetical protein